MRWLFSGRSRHKTTTVSLHSLLIASAAFTGIGLLLITLRSLDDPLMSTSRGLSDDVRDDDSVVEDEKVVVNNSKRSCASVEEMGDEFRGGFVEESVRVRDVIRRHFDRNGASRVRSLPPEEFCKQSYVIAKASEAGFGNEMYKILNAAALSVMLNRSLIIGQTRGKYPFGEYISYTNTAFALSEVKHLWRQNGCLTTYGKHLVIRIDDFQRPRKTNVLCSNWREWEEPIIWFQNTTDAVAAQFFLKNVHVEMRKAASDLFGEPQSHNRPNVFGELMRILISPTEKVKQVVDSVLSGGSDPDITLHMRMLMNRSVRALQAALECTKKVLQNTESGSRPRLVLVSDTPSLVEDVKSNFDKFAEVVHFDYESYEGELSDQNGLRSLDFRTKDWGPAPRWVAFVDFFLASRARRAVVSGAHRRVGTTYVQLIAALAAANSADSANEIATIPYALRWIAIFGEGPPFRFEFCSAFLIYGNILHPNLRLFGTIQAAVGGFSPDPLGQQNGFSDIFNREFTNPVRITPRSHDLYDLRYASLPVSSSTSVVQIAAKLYVTSDTVDDMEIFTQDYMDIDTRPAQPAKPVDTSVLLQRLALWDRFSKLIDNKGSQSNSKAPCTLQKTVKKKPCYLDDEALQVCDAHAFINIPVKPNGGSGCHTIEGKDGSLEISYVVLKYAVYADLEIEFESTSKQTNLTGRIMAYYGKDFDYCPSDEFYHVMLSDFNHHPAFVKPGKLDLMRSVLAVPAKSSLIIAACLYDGTSQEEILSNSYEFFVPRDFRSSVVTIAGKDCSLKVAVNWKLPNSPAPSSNSSVSRLVKTEGSKFGANSTSIMADPDERNRWSLQEEIAKVFNTSLGRTFSPREAVSCSISTCIKEDGGDYLCSSVLHIWPELRDTSYRGPKHAGVAVKDNIMASEYKDMMERCVVCGPGFVKFQLCREWIAKSILKMLRDGIDTWAPKLSVKKAIIYSLSPDIFDMGQLRSTSVGETLARMLHYFGVVVHRKSIHDGDHLDIEGKSSYDLYISETLDLLRGNGLTVVREGNETVFIEGRKLPLVYLTDLRHALDVEKADWIVYVTDVGQRDYIETCITTAKRVGLITDDHSICPVSHVGVGHVQGDDLERFQTSNTEVVSLVNLLDEAKTRWKVLLAGQAGMANECTAEELEYAAESLGYVSVMYENLKNNRLTNYTFSFDQMFNEGNTVVYLHYTHHQVLSIIMSSSEDIEELMAGELILMNDDERELGLHLLRFTEVLGEACTILAPHILCCWV